MKTMNLKEFEGLKPTPGTFIPGVPLQRAELVFPTAQEIDKWKTYGIRRLQDLKSATYDAGYETLGQRKIWGAILELLDLLIYTHYKTTKHITAEHRNDINRRDITDLVWFLRDHTTDKALHWPDNYTTLLLLSATKRMRRLLKNKAIAEKIASEE